MENIEDLYIWNNDYVFDYINSNSIAKYLKRINYEFSTLETTWVFINCNTKPLKDRHAALRELMEKLPDCEVEISQKGICYSSLFDLLEKYITIEEQAVEDFFRSEEGRVYDVQVLAELNSEWIGVSSPFTTLEALLNFCKNTFPSFEYLDVSKAYINKPTLHPFVIYNNRGEILSIQGYNFDEEDSKIWQLFNYDIRVNIPVPFERGDILINRYKKLDVSGNGDPFILDGFVFNTDADNEINGIFYDTDDKSFSHGNLSVFNNDYMDLEYYKGPLKGALCLLSPISSLMAEKLDEVEALNEYLDNFKNNILIG